MQSSLTNIVLFSWGYWGWGSCSGKFVESVDLVERARGFEPPLFVDARFRRNVRAPGFQGAAFEEVVGPKRYRWMNGLGNKGIDTGDRELNDPKAIQQLLTLAHERAAQNQRIIFYCACEVPRDCHRHDITEEVVKLAKKQKREVCVVEWPGTDMPESPVRWNVPRKVIATVEQGRKSIDVPEGVSLADAAAVAWYTPAFLISGTDELAVLVGPARYQKDRWVVPVLEIFDEHEVTTRQMRRVAAQRRSSGCYGCEGSPPTLTRSGA